MVLVDWRRYDVLCGKKVRSGFSIVSIHCIRCCFSLLSSIHANRFLFCSFSLHSLPWTVQFFIRLGVPSITILFSMSVLFTWFSSTFLFSYSLCLDYVLFSRSFSSYKNESEHVEASYFFSLKHEQFAKWSFIFLVNLNSKFDQVSLFFSFGIDQRWLFILTDFLSNSVYDSETAFYKHQYHFRYRYWIH